MQFPMGFNWFVKNDGHGEWSEEVVRERDILLCKKCQLHHFEEERVEEKTGVEENLIQLLKMYSKNSMVK